MASAGIEYVTSKTLRKRPDEVMAELLALTTGAQGYSVSPAGANSIVLTRRYRPTWAIVVAILGLCFFLVGLLALLVKNSETATISLSEADEGTRVHVGGRVSKEMAERLNAAFSGVGVG